MEADKESTLDETHREKDLPRDWRDLRTEAQGLERTVVACSRLPLGSPSLCMFMNFIAAGPAPSVAIFCCRDLATAGVFQSEHTQQ